MIVGNVQIFLVDLGMAVGAQHALVTMGRDRRVIAMANAFLYERHSFNV